MMLLYYRRVDCYYKQSNILLEGKVAAGSSMATLHIQFTPRLYSHFKVLAFHLSSLHLTVK